MKKLIAFLIAGILITLPAAVFAQEATTPAAGETSEQGITPDLYRWSTVLDREIAIGIWEASRLQERQIGTISDVVLNEDGSLTFAQVAIEGFSSIQSGTYLVPIERFTVDDLSIMLNIQDPQQDLIPVRDEQLIRQYFEPGSVRATHLTDFRVIDSTGTEIGYVNDIVIDISSGQVVYVALGRRGFLGLGSKLIAVSFDELSTDIARAQVQIPITEAQFERMRGIDSEVWPVEAMALGVAAETDGEIGDETEQAVEEPASSGSSIFGDPPSPAGRDIPVEPVEPTTPDSQPPTTGTP